LGKREKPFQERFFPSSPNPITLFQTFSWHFSFLCEQKRKVPSKFKKNGSFLITYPYREQNFFEKKRYIILYRF